MTATAAIFVSKRLQRPAFALICLIMVQAILTTVASCSAEPVAMGAAARVAITR